MLSVSENLGGAAGKESILGRCFYSAGQGKELKRRSFPCTPSWLEPQDGQPSLLMLVGPIVSIKAGPNQVVKSSGAPPCSFPPMRNNHHPTLTPPELGPPPQPLRTPTPPATTSPPC